MHRPTRFVEEGELRGRWEKAAWLLVDVVPDAQTPYRPARTCPSGQGAHTGVSAIHKERILIGNPEGSLGRSGDDNPQIRMEIPSKRDEVPALTLNSLLSTLYSLVLPLAS
jgi:hypothetical protein